MARRGYLFASAAYLTWGFFPLYFKLLQPATPLEILAHRIVWSAVFVAALLAGRRAGRRAGWRRWGFLAELARRPRTLAGIGVAAALIALNWGVYIFSVSSSQVVEASLGYFINPLVTVLLGVVILGERLRVAQWAALGAGAIAVAVLTIDHGRLPWIALTLAGSFAGYGLAKKRLALPAAEGLFVEASVLALPAAGYLGVLTVQGRSTLGQISTTHTVLLLLAGAVTAVPLLWFAGAANRIPLSALGILQYVTPILQLGFGVLVFHEPMPPARLVGFCLVWLALAVFTWDGLRRARRPAPGRRFDPVAPEITPDGLAPELGTEPTPELAAERI